MLHEVSSARDIQQLEPAADREGRHVALERGGEERELAGIAARLRRVGLGMGIGAVAGRVDVGPAREDDRVERVERLLDVLLGGRDDDGSPPGALHRVDVRERHERGGQLPHAPARLLRVRGDPDDGSHAASLSTIQSVPSAHSSACPSAGSRLVRSTRTVSPSSSTSAPRGPSVADANRHACTCL